MTTLTPTAVNDLHLFIRSTGLDSLRKVLTTLDLLNFFCTISPMKRRKEHKKHPHLVLTFFLVLGLTFNYLLLNPANSVLTSVTFCLDDLDGNRLKTIKDSLGSETIPWKVEKVHLSSRTTR